MTELSEETWRLIRKLFLPEQHAQAAALLEKECGNNLPFFSGLDPYRLERFRYAALKLSGGSLTKLEEAVAVANRDWRDLLVAAGFGNSLEAHKKWALECVLRSNPEQQ